MSRLSAEQSAAAHALHDGIAVLAGAGCGKTTTVIESIRYRIRSGCDPHQIAAITFTRRAARELKQRLGADGRGMNIGTIDSLALRVVEGRTSKCAIMGEGLASLVCSVIADAVGVPTRRIPYDEYDRRRRSTLCGLAPSPDRMDAVNPLYSSFQRASSHFDYTELIQLAIETVDECEAFKHLKWIYVDESQDTDPLQWKFIDSLRRVSGAKLVMVGDLRQRIFTWRGADPDGMTSRAWKFYPVLTSYRCAPSIIEAANRLIANNPEGDEPMRADSREPGPVEFEFDNVARAVKRYMHSMYQPGDIAVLCRTNRMCDEVTKLLKESDIPVYQAGGEDDWSWQVSALCSFIAFPQSAISCIAFSQLMKDVGIPIGNFLLTKHVDIISELALHKESEAARSLLKVSMLCVDPDKLMGELLADVDLPIAPEASRALRGRYAGVRVDEILDVISSPREVEEVQSKVTVATIHKTKGLEYPVVIMPGLQQGWFPSRRSLKSIDDLEEERRIFYVGMTRAIESLCLMPSLVEPSQFVTEALGDLATEAIAEEMESRGKTKNAF